MKTRTTLPNPHTTPGLEEERARRRDTTSDGRWYFVAPRLRAELCAECLLRAPADAHAARAAAEYDRVDDDGEYRSLSHAAWCRVERAAGRDPHAL